MKINSNIQAMVASNVLRSNEARQSASTQKMSSGYKINNAKDDPAGMAISNRMRAQIQNLNRSNQNASNAVNVIEIAEGALSEMQDMVQRMNELAIKAANDTNTDEDRMAIQKEINQLSAEIDRISKDTEYNGQKLLNGEQSLKGYSDTKGVTVVDYDPDFPIGSDFNLSFNKGIDYSNGQVSLKNVDVSLGGSLVENVQTDGNIIKVTTQNGAQLTVRVDDSVRNGNSDTRLDLKGIGGMKIQVGAYEGQEINIVIPEVSANTLGLDTIDVSKPYTIDEAIEKTKNALSSISSVRARLGAYENRFEKTISNLDVAEENLTDAYSTIKDVDMADEMVEYTTLQVLVQAGTSMLSQANEQPQQALQLLQ